MKKEKNVLFAIKVLSSRKCPDCESELENGICHECGYGEKEESESKSEKED